MSQSRDAAFLLGAVSATLALAAAAFFLPLSVALVAVAGLIFTAAVISRRSPRLTACVGLLLIMCSVSSPALPVEQGGPSIALRVVGSALVVAAGLMADPAPRPAWRPMARIFLPGLGVFIVASTLPLGQVGDLLLLVASLGLLGAYTVFIGRLPSAVLGEAVIAALLIFVIGSLLAGVITPEDAIERGRLRGLAENANGLGCYAFLLAGLALTWVRRHVLTALCLAVSGTAIVWTGSRNSALAVIVVAALLGVSSLRGRVALTVGAIGGALLYPLITSDVTSVLGRLVTGDNTRAETFSYATDVLARYPWTGIGLNNQTVEVASSPMRAIVSAGVWGALAVVIMWVGLVAVGYLAGRRTLALALGCVVFSIFEGTLLSPLGAGLFLTLAALASTVEPVRAEMPESEEISSVYGRPLPISQ